MNLGATRHFSSTLLAPILLRLQDTPVELFVDKTDAPGFVLALH
jgi:hypothetical protein